MVIHLWPQMVQETIPAPQTVTAVAQHVDVVHSGVRKCLEAAAHVVQHEHHDDQREHLRVPVGLADCLQSKPTRGASFSQRVVPKDTVSSLLHVACPAAPAAPLALKPLWIRSTAGTAVTQGTCRQWCKASQNATWLSESVDNRPGTSRTHPVHLARLLQCSRVDITRSGDATTPHGTWRPVVPLRGGAAAAIW